MAGSVNKTIHIGRLTKPVETRQTPSGTNVCSFSIATSENYKDKNGQKQQKTEYHNIVAWDKLAVLCGQYLEKGRLVYIEGKLQTRSWDDNQGNKRYTTEILANTVQFLESKNSANNNNNGYGNTYAENNGNEPIQQSNEPVIENDLPF